MKIEWANYIDGNSTETVRYTQLDKSLYESQYVGKLFCVSPNCSAEMKFTERRNGTKFFSTMNNQGASHDLNCPFYLIYEGETSGKQSLGDEIGSSVSDEHIINTLNNKSRSMKRREEIRHYKPRTKKNSRRTINSGQEIVSQIVDNGTIGESPLSSRIRINSLNSNFVTDNFLGQRKCVSGKIVSLVVDEAEGYGSIRLENAQQQINAFIPPAFYSDPTVTTRNALKIFLNIVQRELDRDNEMMFICVGMIQKNTNGHGININVINPSHFIINGEKYYPIITSGEVGRNPYN